jgi:hypothetical protein
MTFSPWFRWLGFCGVFLMTRLLFTQEPQRIVLLSYSRWGDGKSTAIPNFISAAESASSGIAAPAPAVSASALSHKKHGLPESALICDKALLREISAEAGVTGEALSPATTR